VIVPPLLELDSLDSVTQMDDSYLRSVDKVSKAGKVLAILLMFMPIYFENVNRALGLNT
jgi:hypothetical protein